MHHDVFSKSLILIIFVHFLSTYAAGHLYLFLESILPQTHGLNLLKTPSFLYSFFPPTMNRNAPGARAAPRPQGT